MDNFEIIIVVFHLSRLCFLIFETEQHCLIIIRFRLYRICVRNAFENIYKFSMKNLHTSFSELILFILLLIFFNFLDICYFSVVGFHSFQRLSPKNMKDIQDKSAVIYSYSFHVTQISLYYKILEFCL